ncbi:MAG TPA: hypothetical protein VL069_02545 [Opitutus sp.]|nr:hypothetical protein [Opitutus sp.]
MRTPFAIRVVFWAWLFAAIGVGRFFVLQRLPLLAVPGILFGLTALLVLTYRLIAPFRNWVDSLDLRALVLLHVTRFVGVYFLVLYRRGELPYAFAVPGGIGDIIVAALAILVVLLPLTESKQLRAIYIWNVIGFVDILLVVLAAARIILSGGFGLLPLTYLPLSLLPTFLVPLIIASHLAIFARLARLNRSTP